MSKHTPIPWVVDIAKDGGNWKYDIRTAHPHNPAGGPGKHIATCNGHLEARGDANAAFIVRAVNSHDALLAACKEMRHLSTMTHEEACAQMDAAIAKAEGR